MIFGPDTRILVVDDVKSMRSMVIEALRDLGLTRVAEAADGAEAMRILENARIEKRPIELVISDMNMPVMSGMELLQKLRDSETYAQLPFLMCTTEGEKVTVLKALSMGVSHYLVKPVRTETLRARLIAVWAKHFGPRAA